MAKNAEKSVRAGNRKRGQGRRNGPASGAGQRRANTTANPRKNFERYTALARDAAAAGDAIQAENYFQHADHYLRQMALS